MGQTPPRTPQTMPGQRRGPRPCRRVGGNPASQGHWVAVRLWPVAATLAGRCLPFPLHRHRTKPVASSTTMCAPPPGAGVLPHVPYTPGLREPLAWEDVRGSGHLSGVAHSPLVAEPGLDTVSPPDSHTDAVLDGSHLSPHCNSTDLENCTSAKVASAPHLERLLE